MYSAFVAKQDRDMNFTHWTFFNSDVSLHISVPCQRRCSHLIFTFVFVSDVLSHRNTLSARFQHIRLSCHCCLEHWQKQPWLWVCEQVIWAAVSSPLQWASWQMSLVLLLKPCQRKFQRGARCRLTTFVRHAFYKTALASVPPGRGAGDNNNILLWGHPSHCQVSAPPPLCVLFLPNAAFWSALKKHGGWMLHEVTSGHIHKTFTSHNL